MRLPSVTVFAVNVAIINDRKQTPQHYRQLLQMLYEARIPVRMPRGESELFFGWLSPTLELSETYVRGYIDRAIDVRNRNWFNEIERQPASEKELSEIRIPIGLKANHREFTFLFDLERHWLFVDNSDRGAKILPSQAATLFKELTSLPSVRRKFGLITVSVVRSRLKLSEILALPVKSLTMSVQQDNGDLVSSALRDSVLEQMKEAKAKTAEVTLGSPSSGGRLAITEQIVEFAELAADTGDVEATVLIDGRTRQRNLGKYPVEGTATFDPRNEERFSGMIRAIQAAVKMVRTRRKPKP